MDALNRLLGEALSEQASVAATTSLSYHLQQHPIEVYEAVVDYLTDIYHKSKIHADINVPTLYRGFKWVRSKARQLPLDNKLNELCKEIIHMCPHETIVKQAQHVADAINRHMETHNATPLIRVGGAVHKIVNNRLLSQRRLKYGPKKKKLMSLLLCGLFGNHLQVDRRAGTIDYDDCILVERFATESVLQAVNTTKLQEQEEMNQKSKRVSMLALKYPVAHQLMFQFKYYAEQEPLVIPEDRLAEIMDVLTGCREETHPGNLDPDVYKISCLLMIKLMIDQYISGEPEGVDLLCSVFLEMLASGVKITQVNAFDLFFNLCLHLHFLEDPFPANEMNTDSTSSTFGTANSDSQGSLRLNMIMDDLFQKLCVMLQWIIGQGITDSHVWNAAWQCLLVNLVANGTIDYTRLLKVDIRALLNVVKYIGYGVLTDDVYHHLVRMITNHLYGSYSKLDIDKIETMGGIEIVLELYTRTRSPEARDNLFMVIYDYVIWTMSQSRRLEVPEEQADLVLDILRTLDAPQFLVQAVKYVPEKFVERFVRYVYLEEIKRDPEWFSYQSSATTPAQVATPRKKRTVDKTFLVAILYDFERVARLRSRMCPELELIYDRVGTHVQLQVSDVKLIKNLFQGSHYEERLQGTKLLVRLMVWSEENPFGSVKVLCEEIMDWMVSTGDFLIIGCYLDVVEMILLHRKFQMENASSDDITKLIHRMSDYLGKIMVSKESNVENLVRVMDIVLQFLLLPSDEKMAYEPDSDIYSTFDAFLRGRFMLKKSLLMQMDIRLFHFLFQNLPSPGSMEEPAQDAREWMSYSAARTVILYLMIELCTASGVASLDTIGGMGFFRELVVSRDALVAYLASQFLVQQLAAEKPAQYEALLKKLCQKMKISEEELTGNSYLAIRAIMGQRR